MNQRKNKEIENHCTKKKVGDHLVGVGMIRLT